MDVEIKCWKCGKEIEHRCSPELDEAIETLKNIKVGLPVKEFKGSYYREGDEDKPFFSEAYLYNLLGKEEARTILAVVRNLINAAGREL